MAKKQENLRKKVADWVLKTIVNNDFSEITQMRGGLKELLKLSLVIKNYGNGKIMGDKNEKT